MLLHHCRNAAVLYRKLRRTASQQRLIKRVNYALFLALKMENAELCGWVARGRQRTLVMEAFSQPMTATQIKKKLENSVSIHNVCDVLRSFKDKGLARCLNPGDRSGRIYGLTEIGECVRDWILKTSTH
jgi:hypothetical protein